MNKQTISVHAGQNRDENLGMVNPIDPSTAFQYVDAGDQYYPRYFNTPNQSLIIEKLCRLEEAEAGVLFSSGMAAISTTLMAVLKSGDHAVFLNGLYGGTHSFVAKELAEFGASYTFAGCGVDELMAACNERTKVIFVETPTNPMLDIVDLQELAAAARQRNILTIIDNTFASPINQTPIELGIDVVVHSGTKYLGGHSDLSFGVALGAKAVLARIHSKAIHFGGNVNAITCYLIERSLKTLAVRVEKQNGNAMAVARFLSSHPGIKTVHYPGLPDHPHHALADKQMTGFGGMLSFEATDDLRPQELVQRLSLIAPAMSLGGVESTVTIPVFTAHRLMPASEREALGITERLVRMSVGIEGAEDLVADLAQALVMTAVSSTATS